MPFASRPKSAIDPPSGRRWPDTQFSRVVLPAPFPPMRPTISPSPTRKETPSSTCRPPKEGETPSTTSGSAPGMGPKGGSGSPDQGPAHAAGAQGPQAEDGEGEDGEAQVVAGPRRVQFADQGQPRMEEDGVAGASLRHPRVAEQPGLGGEGEGKCGDGEEEAAEA